MSFLDALKRYYDLFESTNGVVPMDYKMPKYINDLFTFLFIFYDRYQNKQSSFPNKEIFEYAKLLSDTPPVYNVLKDEENNCYMKVWSSDGKVSITIIKDNINPELYKNVGGIKINESAFADALDIWRRRTYSKRDISPSVLKDEDSLTKVDLWNEMQMNRLIDYMCGKEEEKNTIEESEKEQPTKVFLDRFNEFYEIFQKAGDLIPQEYKMPTYFNEFCTYLLIMGARQEEKENFPNSHTFKIAQNFSSEVPIYNIKKDIENNCYMQIWAPNGKTSVVVYKDNVEPNLYADIKGIKLSESEFARVYDKWRKRVYEKDDIQDSILKNKRDINPVDIYEEMEFDKIVDYTKKYNKKKRIERFNRKSYDLTFVDIQTSTSIKRGPNTGIGTVPRTNDVIPYEKRMEILWDYEPDHKITWTATNTGRQLETFFFIREGNILCVLEPVTGMGYQYLLNMGPKLDLEHDKKRIEEIIDIILTTPEDIIMMDDAIIRKNHTTLEVFRENLEVFLNNAKSIKPIYYDTEKSKKVYI